LSGGGGHGEVEKVVEKKKKRYVRKVRKSKYGRKKNSRGTKKGSKGTKKIRHGKKLNSHGKKKSTHGKKKSTHGNSHGKKKSAHGSKKDGKAHGHDGEHKKGEIIHDAASLIAEIATVVILSSYLIFALMVVLGYSVRNCRRSSTNGVHKPLCVNMVGGFDDPDAVNSRHSLALEKATVDVRSESI